MNFAAIVVALATAKRLESRRDPFVMPLLATVFWTFVLTCVAFLLLPSRGSGVFATHLIAFLLIVINNWAFWKSYFVAKQNRED